MIPLWLRIYKLFIMVILPSILNAVFNLSILYKVKVSTQHITAVAMKISTTNSNTKCIHARDVCLLKHILFIHIVFVIGWGPISLLSIIEIYVKIPFLLRVFLQLLQYLREQFFNNFISKSNK
jgi:hypothetical protein